LRGNQRLQLGGPTTQLFGSDDLLASLDLDSWLASLGIQPKADRWDEAVQTLRRAQKEMAKIGTGGVCRPVPNYIHGSFEALEALQVYMARARY
jgi:hypothetical protein